MRDELVFRSLAQARSLGFEPVFENAKIYATENEIKYNFSPAVFHADVWRRLHNSPYMDSGDLNAAMFYPNNANYKSDFYTWYILIPGKDRVFLRHVCRKEGEENAFITDNYCDDTPFTYSSYRDPRIWSEWVRKRDRNKPQPKNERVEAAEAEITAIEAELKALKERSKINSAEN